MIHLFHRWQETARKYNPPRFLPMKFSGFDDGILRDNLYGYTVISQVCRVCGTPRTVKVYGEHIPGPRSVPAPELRNEDNA